ncbi:MAG: hypothetical protein SWO11_20655, partial [Thermodesulfobacteriota bacterium]|nr:hypothetical protein [Thermodesulfobacteriota bacterium]
QWRGYPEAIRVDKGSEFMSRNMEKWAKKHKVPILLNLVNQLRMLILNALTRPIEKISWTFIFSESLLR